MFELATAQEKEYMVKMRPSSTFFKDGVKRLLKNKIATISFFVVVAIALSCIIIPFFWPYSYEQQLGVRSDDNVDGSYGNLGPFEYGFDERVRKFGQATVQYVYFPMNSQGSNADAVKAQAEAFLTKYNGGANTTEAFEALAQADPSVEYAFVESAGYKQFTFVDKWGTKATDDSIIDWLWETKSVGKSV